MHCERVSQRYAGYNSQRVHNCEPFVDAVSNEVAEFNPEQQPGGDVEFLVDGQRLSHADAVSNAQRIAEWVPGGDAELHLDCELFSDSVPNRHCERNAIQQRNSHSQPVCFSVTDGHRKRHSHSQRNSKQECRVDAQCVPVAVAVADADRHCLAQ